MFHTVLLLFTFISLRNNSVGTGKDDRLVKQPSQRRPSNRRAFIETLIQCIAVKLISFRSVNHPLFQQMVQRANSDFSVPVHKTLKYHIKRLAEVYIDNYQSVKNKVIAV
jgi:hypothetical protein